MSRGGGPIPAHVERQLLFLISRIYKEVNPPKQCWIMKKCPKDRKYNCPAWEFKAGKLCWFINGPSVPDMRTRLERKDRQVQRLHCHGRGISFYRRKNGITRSGSWFEKSPGATVGPHGSAAAYQYE